MRSLGKARPDFGVPANGNGSGCHELRMRLDGFDCCLAEPLVERDLASLVAALAAPDRGKAISPKAGALSGRATVWRHEIPTVGPVVIKEFQRGGMLRVFRRRHYLRVGATRPEREFENLKAARCAGLNVPEPLAWFSRGTLLYRGWLATRFIAGRSVVEVARGNDERLPDIMRDLVRQVGIMIANRVAHVDLHPGNVLVDEGGTVFILDFDRAIAFTESLEELRRHYEVRWTRAVEKHGLPAILAERFRQELFALPLREP